MWKVRYKYDSKGNIGCGCFCGDFFSLDLDAHTAPKSITLAKRCWMGMNSIILSGVTLGDHTIVGAGSVVTKSFPEGECVIAGNTA